MSRVACIKAGRWKTVAEAVPPLATWEEEEEEEGLLRLWKAERKASEICSSRWERTFWVRAPLGVVVETSVWT